MNLSMIDFLVEIYSVGQFTQKNVWKRLFSLSRLIIRSISNVVLPVYLDLTKNLSQYRIVPPTKGSIEVVVSLTSFPARINTVWLVIESLLRQKVKPDKLILWLSKDQFSSIDVLPKRLKSQILRGLEIRFVEGDLRSH